MRQDPESRFRGLSKRERAVLEKLLSKEFPGRTALCRQLEEVEVRRIDAEGSLALRPGENAPKADVLRRIPIEAEFAGRDGIKIHLLLHVVGGLMNELEIYREDSGPVQCKIDVDQLSLIVL